MEITNYRSMEMHKKNRLRSLKVQAVLDVITWIDKGKVPKSMKLKLSKLANNFSDVNDNNFMPLATVKMQDLKDNINSYRARQIGLLCGININKNKLLKFAKPKNHIYSLNNDQFLLKIDRNRVEIKQMIVIKYHNLKLKEFPELEGLFANEHHISEGYLTVDSIMHETPIFAKFDNGFSYMHNK